MSAFSMSHRARRLLWIALPWLTALAVVAAWQGIVEANTSLVPRDAVSTPTSIAGALWDQAGTDRFWSAVEQTLKAWAFGLGLAFAFGVPLGIAIGSSRRAYRGIRSTIELLRPVPGITLLPLLVLLLGLGFQLKLFLVVVAAFWPLFLQSTYGVQDVDPVALEMARAYGLGPTARFWRIVLPSAAPYIATGLRLSATVALEVAIAVELLVGGHGIGTELGRAETSDRMPTMWAYVVTACLLGLAINLGVRRSERRLLRWHASQRTVVPV